MNVVEFRNLIANCEPFSFCQDQLFDLSSWLFEHSNLDELTGDYSNFREAVSESIGVEADDIRLVGSSKFGYSMSPKPEKRFRLFTPESDLDVVIVSSDLFSEIWGEFRFAYYNGYGWIKNRHGSDIFRRFLYLLPGERYETTYLRTAARRLDGIAKNVILKTGLSRDLKYRIYASWDDAVDYHAYGVKKLQRALEHAA